ncbi:MAG TPA: PAS domain S-box protein [Catenuloplanes sp.]|jgi:PAS domain S-box-containing protein
MLGFAGIVRQRWRRFRPSQSIAGVRVAGVPIAGASVAGLATVLAVYAGRARRGRADLSASEQRFRGLFENTLVGMVFTALDGSFLTVNQALCQMVGRSADELEHRGWQALTHPDDRAESAREVAEVIAGRRRGFRLAKRYLHSDGRVIHVEVTSTLLRDDSGQPLHFVTQILDVSERHRLQEQQERIQDALAEQAAELRRANAELQHANRRIADLVTMLAHDVRQPLGAIAGYCALLLDGWQDSSDAEKQTDLRRLATAGRSANQLVEEVLTLTQLDADAARPSTTRVWLVSALATAVDVLPALDRAAITIDTPADLVVLVDPRHLHQILVNLIGNACKYGAAPIRLASVRHGDAVEVSVSDAGQGVPTEFVPRLFDRFTRASTGVAPERQGTGVGLYIVRQLAEANGASIRYQPNRPHGSTFVVRLPGALNSGHDPVPHRSAGPVPGAGAVPAPGNPRVGAAGRRTR